MRVRVQRVREEADRIKSFELRAEDGTNLPAFTAGSHVRVRLELPGGEPAERHYSIVSDPADRARYELAVQLEENGSGGSQFMHNAVCEGSSLEISPPVNDFPLTGNASHYILIAGGIGITPILSMLRVLSRRGASFEVHYSARSRDRMAYYEEVLRLAPERAQVYFTRETPTQRLDISGLLAESRHGTHIYVCGPGAMIEAVRESARRFGWSENQIHLESFGGRRREDDRPFEVELAQSGLVVHVPADQSVLDASLNAGVWATYECKRGECSWCMTPVLEGQVDHRDHCLTEEQREEYMCTCVSRARGEKVVLDL